MWMISANKIIMLHLSLLLGTRAKMTDKIGSFVIDIEGKELSPEDKELLAHPLVGGVIFFTRNYESLAQIKALSKQIRAARKSPILIMVDQEGGRVQRFIKDFTRLPRMAVFGKMYDNDAKKACQLAIDCGWLMASEILTAGMDLSLAPVLDLYTSVSSVIGERAFHADPKIVIELANAFIAGMREAGMAATGKHFPGHGSQAADSHVALPEDTRQLEDIIKLDLIPFAALIRDGIPAIMAAHIVFPQVDKLPVGFSRVWLQDILRKKLEFKGIIFSDDLNMEGANISTNYADRVVAAREAGCDFALLCNNRPGVIQVIDNLAHVNHMLNKEKWAPLQGKTQTGILQETPRWQLTQAFLQNLVTTQ